MDTTQEIYLDNSATTRVSKEAAEKALYMMTECYGNPSSLHSKGFAAEKEMTAAREIIADRQLSVFQRRAQRICVDDHPAADV